MEMGMGTREGKKKKKKKRNRKKKKEKESGLPFFRILVQLRMGSSLRWLKLDPPADVHLDEYQDGCFAVHTHPDSGSMKNFSTQKVDTNTPDLIKCKYPLNCCCASISSTVYCVGGDINIDGGIKSIMSEKIGCSITSRHDPNTIIPDPMPVRVRNLSHGIGSFDFFYPRPHQWKLKNAPRLVSPRYLPKIVAVGGKIFLFGGNRPPLSENEYVPFAEVFDPATGTCAPLKDPPFPNRIGVSCLFVVPSLGSLGEQKILVMSKAIYVSRNPPAGYDAICLYDVQEDSWEQFTDSDRMLHYMTMDIVGDPVPVAEHDSIYWLNADKFTLNPGLICSYNWKTKEFRKGHFLGLHHENPFLYFRNDTKILLHLHQDLFFIVWDDEDRNGFTDIHFTLLRVSKEDPSCSLSALVVGCFSYRMPVSKFVVLDAFLLF